MSFNLGHKKPECSGRSSQKRGYQLASPSAACFHSASLPPNIQGDDYSLIRPTRVRGSDERAQRERAWGPVGLSSRPLIAVSHHAIDPPGSFRCQKRFHNSLIPTNLRDKLGGVESVNGAPRPWNPVAGSFFTSPPASFTAGILPLCKDIEVRLQVCVFQGFLFVCMCVCGGPSLQPSSGPFRPPRSDSRKFD